MKIAIDPGHGMNNAGSGFDSGAEAAGFREADMALDYGLQLQKAFAKAGRNDQCPCGSGRKAKHCHG